jgi:hypothetical protein
MIQSCSKIQEILKTTFGDSIHEYFIDDPSLVIFSSLPCLAVAPISTDIDILDTAKDSWTYTIDIVLIIDAKQELNKFKKEMVGTRYLVDTMEGKSSNGSLRANTVLYVLRSNLKLGDNWYINNISKIDYSLRTRLGEGGKQFVTKEATLRLSIVRIQNRP